MALGQGSPLPLCFRPLKGLGRDVLPRNHPLRDQLTAGMVSRTTALVLEEVTFLGLTFLSFEMDRITGSYRFLQGLIKKIRVKKFRPAPGKIILFAESCSEHGSLCSLTKSSSKSYESGSQLSLFYRCGN